MLDRARLLAPGTLVEEALRRSIAVATKLADMHRFLRLSRAVCPHLSAFALCQPVRRRLCRRRGRASRHHRSPGRGRHRRHDGARAGEGHLSAHRAPRRHRRADRPCRLRRTHAESVEDDPRAELYSSLSAVTSGTGRGRPGEAFEDRPQPVVGERPPASRCGGAPSPGNDWRPSRTETCAGAKACRGRTRRREVRSVGPEPPCRGSAGGAPAAGSRRRTPLRRKRCRSRHRCRTMQAKAPTRLPKRPRRRLRRRGRKLADMDKLLGDMPE